MDVPTARSSRAEFPGKRSIVRSRLLWLRVESRSPCDPPRAARESDNDSGDSLIVVVRANRAHLPTMARRPRSSRTSRDCTGTHDVSNEEAAHGLRDRSPTPPCATVSSREQRPLDSVGATDFSGEDLVVPRPQVYRRSSDSVPLTMPPARARGHRRERSPHPIRTGGPMCDRSLQDTTAARSTHSWSLHPVISSRGARPSRSSGPS
jgi:hypothetical protein